MAKSNARRLGDDAKNAPLAKAEDRFAFRGAFGTGTSYALGDVVIFQTGLYRCLVATTGGQSPTTHPARWVTVTPPPVEVENIARLQRAARLAQFRFSH